MRGAFSSRRAWCVAFVIVGSSITACGDDTTVRRNPKAVGDAAVGGTDSGTGGSSDGGDSTGTGGRTSTGGGRSTGGASAGTACTNSLACPTNQVCDQTAGFCVDCLSDSDCGSGLQCVGHFCRAACTSDKQCTPQGLLCNVSLGYCTQCITNIDCGPAESCVSGTCTGVIVGSGGAGGASNGGAGGVTPIGGAGGGVSSGGAGGVTPIGGAGGGQVTCNRADLWIALDQSGSLTTAFDSGMRWDVIRGGLQGFVTSAPRAAAGVVAFPKAAAGVPTSCCVDADCGVFGPCTLVLPGFCPTLPGTCSGSTGCEPSAYDAADIPLTALPAGSNVFVSYLASVSPTGGSPLQAALQRMTVRAAASASANPANRTAVVLLTDGNPGGCTPGNTVPDVANVAAAALAATPSIKTYVITVGIDPATMEPVATAGGTTIFGTSTTATLADATNYVRNSLMQIAASVCP